MKLIQNKLQQIHKLLYLGHPMIKYDNYMMWSNQLFQHCLQCNDYKHKSLPTNSIVV